MEAARKSKKIPIIVWSIIGFLALTYFGGGTGAWFVVRSVIFDHRGSEVSDLEKPENRIYRLWNDYENLRNSTQKAFISGNNTLIGHYVEPPDSKGLVIATHGISCQTHGPEAAFMDYFVGRGYSLFALDLTASGSSEGTSMVSLLQSAYDIASAYAFLQESSLLSSPLILAGYSWGGFGAAYAVSLGVKADKVVTFSAYDCPYEMMLSSARSKVGFLADISIPTFALGTMMSEAESFCRASKKLKETKTPCFVVQGEKDVTVPLHGVSLYEAMDGTDALRYSTDAGHRTPWFSASSRTYVEQEVLPALQQKSLAEQEEYIAGLDKNKTSELDESLFTSLSEFLSKN